MPSLREVQPKPPPSVSPAMPVVELIPIGTASPWACVAASTSASVAPGSTRAVRASGSTLTARICERSSSIAASATARPAIWCPPLRTPRSRSWSRAKRTAATTSAAFAARTTSAGRRSTIAFQSVRASS